MLVFTCILLIFSIPIFTVVQDPVQRFKMLGGLYSLLVISGYFFWVIYSRQLSLLLVDNNGYMSSYYSQRKYNTAMKLMHLSPYVGIIFAVIILIIISRDYDESQLKQYLLIAISCAYLPQLAINGYFVDLICVFTDEFYITGKYFVHYIDIDEITVRKKVNAIQDQVVFIRLYKSSKLIGVDKLTYPDYLELKKHITEKVTENQHHSSNLIQRTE